jgi:pyrimidine operon attenuation protein/uracil phosphoribosyltransferase
MIKKVDWRLGSLEKVLLKYFMEDIILYRNGLKIEENRKLIEENGKKIEIHGKQELNYKGRLILLEKKCY